MRILLFVATNIVFMITVSILCALLGVGNYLTETGIDYAALMVFCLVWGFAGAFFSLSISRWIAKRMLRIKLIDPANPGEHAWILQCVQHASRAANLPALPEVGIY